MPARISRPVREKIAEMHAEGVRYKDIAEATGVSAATVAKYCKNADDQVELARLPASEIDDDDLHLLDQLKSVVRTGPCPSCGAQLVTLTTMPSCLCRACGATWR